MRALILIGLAAAPVAAQPVTPPAAARLRDEHAGRHGLQRDWTIR